MTCPFKVVIPARFGSTRLRGKPLLTIANKPMIAHVCQRAIEAQAQEVIVATDDLRIFDCVTDLGHKALMTQSQHQSGTERINEVADYMGWNDNDIVVNLQGDEPLIPPDYIKEVAQILGNQQRASVATLAVKITDSTEITNPNTVKVVLDNNDYALYFSRATIPYHQPSGVQTLQPYLRHIGIYAYTVNFLSRYCAWQPTTLERTESLEQLRILWQGESIIVKTVATAPIAGVDTAEDLARVEHALLHKKRLTC